MNRMTICGFAAISKQNIASVGENAIKAHPTKFKNPMLRSQSLGVYEIDLVQA